MNDWSAVRRQYLVPEDLTFLNNGSYGPMARPVFEALVGYQRRLAENPSTFGELSHRLHAKVKPKLASFVGGRADLMAVVTNLTMGMNIVARGLRGLSPGDEILLTDQEYGAVVNAWDWRALRDGLIVRKVAIPLPPASAEEIVAIVESGITARTRVLVASHVTSPTGLVLPIHRLCALARERGVFSVVDGAHAPGMLALDLTSIDADFYTGNCHKWLGAPLGTAFIAVAERAADRLDPFIVGWGWHRDRPESFHGNFEHPGVHNVALSNAIGDAVDFQLAMGRDAVEARGRELAEYAKDGVMTVPGISLLSPRDPELCGSMSAFSMPPLEDEKRFGEVLQRRKIVVPAGAGRKGGRGRVSTHVYNSREDVDRLVEALGEIYRC